MENLKRYRMVRDQISEEIYGEQDFGGEWVKFSDIKDILKTPTNTARDAISLLAEFYEYWEDNYAASPDFYEKVRKMCGIAKRHP